MIFWKKIFSVCFKIKALRIRGFEFIPFSSDFLFSDLEKSPRTPRAGTSGICLVILIDSAEILGKEFQKIRNAFSLLANGNLLPPLEFIYPRNFDEFRRIPRNCLTPAMGRVGCRISRTSRVLRGSKYIPALVGKSKGTKKALPHSHRVFPRFAPGIASPSSPVAGTIRQFGVKTPFSPARFRSIVHHRFHGV